MKRVVILGAGFGGLAAATRLRQRLPEGHEILLADRRAHFVAGLRKSWALAGTAEFRPGERPLAALESRGIRFLQAEIESIDPTNRSAVIGGERFEADALIVALGTHHAPETVPGFLEHAHNIYDRAALPRAAEAVRSFGGGRLGIGIFASPYVCPPAPFEMACLLREALIGRGVDADVEVFSPAALTLPVLGQSSCSVIEARLAERGVAFLANHKASSIEAGAVHFASGPRRYDLILGVPPHRCPSAVTESGLADGGAWARVDPATLETRFPGVYAIGDCTEITLAHGLPLPKAGVFAEAQGIVVAERIAAAARGERTDARFTGEGYCYLEIGEGKAIRVAGNFLAAPAPAVEVEEPSTQAFDSKRAFESDRLREWFGG
jgi:sulfide:quinone oxidoreductase